MVAIVDSPGDFDKGSQVAASGDGPDLDFFAHCQFSLSFRVKGIVDNRRQKLSE
jgi:hypothetical protein